MNENTPASDDQLDLFREFQLGAAHVTRSIPNFDLLPFFFISRRNEVPGDTPVNAVQARTHQFQNGEDTISFSVSPAHLTAQGKTPGRMIFPGEREQLVATAIRSLAVRGEAKLGLKMPSEERAKAQHPLVTAAFTVRQVRAELERTNHTFSHAEIVEAVAILTRANATMVTRRPGEDEVTTEEINYYAGSLSQGDKRIVILNRIESQLILAGAYRALRYDKLMALDDPIARWLYQYVHATFRNVPSPTAGKRTPFDITLDELFSRGVLARPKELRKAILRVRSAFELLAKNGHLDAVGDSSGYEEILQTTSTGGRRKLTGATWRYYPSAQDAHEIIDANAEAKMRREEYRHLPPDRRMQMTDEPRKRIQHAPKDPPRKKVRTVDVQPDLPRLEE